MKQRTYHVAFLKGSGNCIPLHQNGHKADTLIIQARQSVDNLSPQAWKYFGERVTTKKRLRENAKKILAQVNVDEGTSFARAIVD